MILDLSLIGIAITVDPIPLTAFILVISSKNGAKKGAAFVFGWLASLAAVMVITFAARGNEPPKPATAPSLASLAIKIAIGTGLLIIALRRRRAMGRPKPPKKPPKWQAGIDNMSPLYAMGLAPLLQPWGLIAAGVATIIEAQLTSALNYLMLLLFGLLASGSYLAIEIYDLFRPERCGDLLVRLRSWMDTHTDQAVIAISLVLGLWLIGKSIYVIVQ